MSQYILFFMIFLWEHKGRPNLKEKVGIIAVHFQSMFYSQVNWDGVKAKKRTSDWQSTEAVKMSPWIIYKT